MHSFLDYPGLIYKLSALSSLSGTQLLNMCQVTMYIYIISVEHLGRELSSYASHFALTHDDPY